MNYLACAFGAGFVLVGVVEAAAAVVAVVAVGVVAAVAAVQSSFGCRSLLLRTAEHSGSQRRKDYILSFAAGVERYFEVVLALALAAVVVVVKTVTTHSQPMAYPFAEAAPKHVVAMRLVKTDPRKAYCC